MIGLIKSYALFPIFIFGLVLVISSFSGRIKFPLLFLTALLPLRNIIEKLHSMPMGKDFVDILFFAIIVGWVVSSITKGYKFFESSPINWIAIVMVIYLFISLIQGAFYLNYFNIFDFSDPRVQDWKNFVMLPILFFLVFNNIREKKDIWLAVFVMCLTMVLMDYYLVQQLRWFSSMIARKKINATFVYLGPNEVAAFYNMFTILLMSLFLYMKGSVKKLCLLGLIFTNIFCILFLCSRAAYLGLAVGMFFLFMIKDRRLLLILAIVLFCWQAAMPQKVKDRIAMTTNEYGELEESAAGRFTIWEHSLHLFEQNPISGVGFGVFRFLGFELEDTHNIYLKILAEQGVIGLLIFLILMFIMFLQGIKLFTGGEEPLEKGLGIGFSALIIVCLINNIFGDRWTYTEVSSNLWVLAALVARLNVIARNNRLEKRKADRAELKMQGMETVV